MKKLTQTWALFTAILAICAALILQPAKPAYASNSAMAAMQGIVEKVDIKDGAFAVKTVTSIPPIPGGQQLRIGQALVSLSPETLKEGTVDSIKITGPQGIEFGCVNLKVKQGTDLIVSCGGPALLSAGQTTYEASGSNFGPDSTGTFSITLVP